jgi:hypothetical protein
MPPRVFVSYVRDNEERVSQLVSELRRGGLEVWWDRDALRPGTFWRDEIRRAIAGHEFFLACFSNEFAARSRTFMNDELETAIAEIRLRGHLPWFIPVLLSGTVPDREIRPGRTLRDIQYVDLTLPNWSQGVKNLLRTLAEPITGASNVALQSTASSGSPRGSRSRQSESRAADKRAKSETPLQPSFRSEDVGESYVSHIPPPAQFSPPSVYGRIVFDTTDHARIAKNVGFVEVACKRCEAVGCWSCKHAGRILVRPGNACPVCRGVTRSEGEPLCMYCLGTGFFNFLNVP